MMPASTAKRVAEGIGTEGGGADTGTLMLDVSA